MKNTNKLATMIMLKSAMGSDLTLAESKLLNELLSGSKQGR